MPLSGRSGEMGSADGYAHCAHSTHTPGGVVASAAIKWKSFSRLGSVSSVATVSPRFAHGKLQDQDLNQALIEGLHIQSMARWVQKLLPRCTFVNLSHSGLGAQKCT